MKIEIEKVARRRVREGKERNKEQTLNHPLVTNALQTSFDILPPPFPLRECKKLHIY